MSLFNSVVGAVTGQTENGTEANPMVAIIGNVISQSGGLQGLMSKFSQAGLGNVFSQWVSTGPNPPVSGDQIQQVLGSDQLKALAAKLGIDPAQVSQVVAEHLPTVVDKLTPAGKIDPNANTEEDLSSMIPSLLQKLGAQATAFGGSQG